MKYKFTFKLIDKERDEVLYYINLYASQIKEAKDSAMRIVGAIEKGSEYYEPVEFEKKYGLVLWQVSKTESVPFYDYSNGISHKTGEQIIS